MEIQVFFSVSKVAFFFKRSSISVSSAKKHVNCFFIEAPVRYQSRLVLKELAGAGLNLR